MDLGVFELQIFVSLIVVLGAAFVALVCDYLKGNNEQLREHNIELRVRKDEQEHRGILDPARWLEQLVGITQAKVQSAAGANEPRPRAKLVEPNESSNSWANRQDQERIAQRGTSMAARRNNEQRQSVEDWVSPEAMARVASNLGRQSAESSNLDDGQPAASESKSDIRDEIQKLVESSPRPRRGKVYPANGSASAIRIPASVPASTEADAGRSQPETAPDLTEPKSESFDASGSGLESVVPALELKQELERVAQTRHRVLSTQQAVTHFPVLQVESLNSGEEMHRVTEREVAQSRAVGGQQVSALLDEVIAASFHRGQREPEPVRPSVQPVTPVTSRPLLEAKQELPGAGFPTVSEAGFPGAGKLQLALQQFDVVVPVQAIAQAIAEAEIAPPAPLVIPWHFEPARVEPSHVVPVELEPHPAVAAEPEVAHEIEAPEDIPPISLETAFSWPPARSFHTPRPDAEPAKFAAPFQTRFEHPTAIDEPRDLTCFEEVLPTGIPQVPEPAMFQAMIESISLMPIETVPPYEGPAFSSHHRVADSTHGSAQVPPTGPPAHDEPLSTGVSEPDGPLTDLTPVDDSDLLLPSGMHDRLVFSRLMGAPGKLSGVVVSISLNDFKKIQDSFTHQAFDDLMRSIHKLMNAMIRDEDFGARLDDSEWIFVFRNEVGAVAQKRILQISEKLWDFQLRSMGSVSILFGWGAVEVENERFSESYNAAIERMEQSRRGRKTVAMDTRGKRRVANG